MTNRLSFPLRPSSSSGKSTPRVQGVTEFLRGHERMSLLLPTLNRMAAIQKDCVNLLPDLFPTCSLLQFEAGQLVLAVPNAAFATKLKQKLPKLQESLLQLGWQVNAIRLPHGR